MKTRRGGPGDLQGLMRLETECFDQARRASERSLRHSLTSRHQEVWMFGTAAGIQAALVLRLHPHTCRITSIAVDPAWRKQGLGARLLRIATQRARQLGCRHVQLEAESRNPALIAWYELHGYAKVQKLPNHYGARRHAWRMKLPL